MYITRVKGECVGSCGSYYYGEEGDHESIYDYYAGLDFMVHEDPDGNSGRDFLEYCWPKELKEFFTSSIARFEYDGTTLFIVVDYFSNKIPTPKQANDIANYTQGQWGDGIGEGYEQQPVILQNDQEDMEFYISMWHQGQKPKVTIHKLEEVEIDTI